MRQYELEKLLNKIKERNGHLYNFSLYGEKLEGRFLNIVYDAEYKTYELTVNFLNEYLTFEFTKQSAVIDFIEKNIPDDMETNLQTIKRLFPIFKMLYLIHYQEKV